MKRKPRKFVPLHPAAEWAVNLLILLFATAMVAQPYIVPSESMEGTLFTGDHIIVDKMAYAPSGAFSRHLLPYQPIRRGDIVVLRSPLNLEENLVKRAIGVPGDRIHIVDRQLWLNGRPVAEPYKSHTAATREPLRDNFPSQLATLYEGGRRMLRDHVIGGELVVPEGHYFLLGDNRDNSLDSRYWGLAPRANIFGKPLLVWWSYDAPTERLMSGNIDPAHLLDIAANFFSKTRWDRTFHLISGYPVE